ncbi:predicted protein [Chaetoceros tenuissimus]|uniref:Uncharacterized protein n=1 Tax=Chaetoceros tenuissimus TaxID=426638 RepID=A0AAD3D8L2_9STRA|nr:predicted protein [Chaetoceros tenuissimus]
MSDRSRPPETPPSPLDPLTIQMGIEGTTPIVPSSVFKNHVVISSKTTEENKEEFEAELTRDVNGDLADTSIEPISVINDLTTKEKEELEDEADEPLLTTTEDVNDNLADTSAEPSSVINGLTTKEKEELEDEAELTEEDDAAADLAATPSVYLLAMFLVCTSLLTSTNIVMQAAMSFVFALNHLENKRSYKKLESTANAALAQKEAVIAKLQEDTLEFKAKLSKAEEVAEQAKKNEIKANVAQEADIAKLEFGKLELNEKLSEVEEIADQAFKDLVEKEAENAKLLEDNLELKGKLSKAEEVADQANVALAQKESEHGNAMAELAKLGPFKEEEKVHVYEVTKDEETGVYTVECWNGKIYGELDEENLYAVDFWAKPKTRYGKKKLLYIRKLGIRMPSDVAGLSRSYSKEDFLSTRRSEMIVDTALYY